MLLLVVTTEWNTGAVPKETTPTLTLLFAATL